MKVYISKYKHNWVSPYTVLEYTFFWTKWSKANRGGPVICEDVPYPQWVESLADRLQPAAEVWNKVASFFNRRVEYVKIDRWDTWSMDHTLALIVVPMLKQVKATKHGVPGEFAHRINPRTGKEVSYGAAEREWNRTLDKMIWSFEQILDEDAEEQFWSGEWGTKVIDKTQSTAMIPPWEDGWRGTRKCDTKGLEKYHARMQEGFDLFGKYYRNLWD